MVVVVADTHALVWYLFKDPRLSPAAKEIFDEAEANGDNIAFSAITLPEIVYLIERGRIGREALQRLVKEVGDEQCILVEIPFNMAVAEAMAKIPRTEVPELPDRLIAATATLLAVPLISRDRIIRASSVKTVW
jgi:PIN domain nuclease of toxin-antitoxin system